jgi:hypothetical protein
MDLNESQGILKFHSLDIISKMKRLMIILLLVLGLIQVEGQILRTYPAYVTASVTAGDTPACLNTNTVAWYDYTLDVTTAGSNVTTWGDQSSSGYDLAESTLRPVLAAGGITFTADQLARAPISCTLPATIYMVLSFPNHQAYSVVFYFEDGISQMLMGGSDGQITFLYGGSGIYNNDHLSYATDILIEVIINGASSKTQVNNLTAHTGTLGTGTAVDLNIGARDANFTIKEFILRNVADGTTDETSIKNYLNTKYTLY